MQIQGNGPSGSGRGTERRGVGTGPAFLLAPPPVPVLFIVKRVPGTLPRQSPPGTSLGFSRLQAASPTARLGDKGRQPSADPRSSDLCYRPVKIAIAPLAILGRGTLRETHCSEEDQSKPGGSPRGGAGPRPTNRLQGWHFQQMGAFYKSHISGQ